MISIIIPVYNVEKYLSECLDSILNQSYSDFEVILINDGSLDNSGTICDEYATMDFRVCVVHQQNSGVSIARNNGIKLAKGEWITFIDSDDWVDTNFLESFGLSTKSDLSIQGLKMIKYPEQSLIEVRDFKEIDIFLSQDYEDIAQNNLLQYGTVCCKAYKKEIITRHHMHFDKSLSYHEDHLFFLQYLQYVNRVSLRKAVSYNYRITNSGHSLSSKVHPWDKLNDSSNVMLRELVHLPLFQYLPKWYSRYMTTYCLQPKISACHYLFDSSLDDDTKKRALNVITRDKAIIYQYYHPVSFQNKFLKLCLLCGYSPTKLFLFIKTATKLIRR